MAKTKLPRKKPYRYGKFVLLNEESFMKLVAYRIILSGNSFNSCYRWVYKRFKVAEYPASINSVQYSLMLNECEQILESVSELSRNQIKQLFRMEAEKVKESFNVSSDHCRIEDIQ